MSWLPINTAPKDGSMIKLRGKRRNIKEDFTEVKGRWGKNWFSEGWEEDNGKWFYAVEWKPIEICSK